MTGLLDFFPLRTEPEPEHDGAPDAPAVTEAGTEAAPAPLVRLEGDRMGSQDHLLAAVAHSFRTARRRAREMAGREGGMVGGLLSGQAPSVRDQHAYAKSRAGVPPGHDGGTVEGMWVIYHWLIGRPGVAAAQIAGGISARPFRWCMTAAGAVIISVIALTASGHRLAAILTGIGAVALTCAWAGAGSLLMRLIHAHLPARDETEDE